MPEIREYFPEIDKMELHQLHERRQAILDSVPTGLYTDLPDEPLAELLAVSRALRKKAAAPGKDGTKKKAGPKEKPTLESLA